MTETKTAAYKRGEYKKGHKGFCLCCNKPIVGNAKKTFCNGDCRQKYARAQKKLSQS